MNVKFFQDLISGKKVVFKNAKCNKVQVTKYPELSVKFALDQIRADDVCLKAIPQHWYKPKAKVDRDYLWSILATVNPKWFEKITMHADN